MLLLYCLRSRLPLMELSKLCADSAINSALAWVISSLVEYSLEVSFCCLRVPVLNGDCTFLLQSRVAGVDRLIPARTDLR